MSTISIKQLQDTVKNKRYLQIRAKSVEKFSDIRDEFIQKEYQLKEEALLEKIKFTRFLRNNLIVDIIYK